jgi:AcrR family transcriptional regulator
MTAETLIESYKNAVLTQGKRPVSVYIFMKEQEAKEEEFYAHFGSFRSLEAKVFKSYVEETLTRLADSKEYQEYDSPQKVLAFFFTWLEVMQPNRSFVQFIDQHSYTPLFSLTPFYMGEALELIEGHANKVVKDGIDDEEIADRLFITRFYKNGIAMQARSILEFWLKDQSEGFENTDAMVEKSVRFTFNLIQSNSLDSGWDLGKFLWRNR